jgi:hypothetical protein
MYLVALKANQPRRGQLRGSVPHPACQNELCPAEVDDGG